MYFLGANTKHRDFVEKLKEITGYQVVILPHIDEFVKADEKCSDVQLYDINPSQFLNLIRNAEYVCTDSFHCTVFSIQYKRKFFTFKRFQSNNKQSTNSRLDTLFDLTGIKGRFMTGNEDVLEMINCEIDYDDVLLKLQGIREYSYHYLESALLDNDSTDLKG